MEEPGRSPYEPEPLLPIFDRVVNDVFNRPKEPPYPTGIHQVDELIWGFHKGELCTIAARPGDGKTSFMLQCMWRLAKIGKKVLGISLEMSKEQLVERLFSHEMAVDNQVLRRGAANEYSVQLEEFSRRLREIPIFLVDGVGATIEQVEKIIEQSSGVDAVFLDYLQLIKSGADRKRNYEIGEYLREFRRISQRKKFCLVSLSQIHRATQDRVNKRPMLHDLKDSGDIEQDSDTVLMLYWNANNEKELDVSKYEVIVAKQRNGEIGTAKLKFEPQYYRFS